MVDSDVTKTPFQCLFQKNIFQKYDFVHFLPRLCFPQKENQINATESESEEEKEENKPTSLCLK